MEFHDGGDAAWKLSLLGLSSKEREGLSFQWAAETGLTNDCPLCQTEAQQYYLNAGVGAAWSGSIGKVYSLAGFESSAWSEDGNQSLGIPVLSVGAEASVGEFSTEISASISETRMKMKRESELRFEASVCDGVALATVLSYRTIADEDDESKIFLGTNFELK
ncbi:MAG: hypothetical protein AAB250_04155 [Bdellovibrionota bacterium]